MSEAPKLYNATCSECGNKCTIPFEPTEGRPVKCNECFRRGRRGFTKKRRKDFEVECDSCGISTTVPFKPTQGKPVLCRECYLKEKEQ